MGQNKLLIAIPTKTAPLYTERAKICEQTWLKDCPCDYKFFSDADLGLTEIDQHQNDVDPIRTWRTKLMVKYAFEHGYDYIFRCDSDAYVWVNRLLNCGFENHDYMGWCLQAPQGEWCINTAHGGVGFFLSRRAMKVVMNSPVDKYGDGKYWGDLWAGHHLWKSGIDCHRDTRFVDGSSHKNHHGNIHPEELPLDHQYVSVHPIHPPEMLDMHKRFASMSDVTIPPEKQLGE
jgi:hypothetical protein